MTLRADPVGRGVPPTPVLALASLSSLDLWGGSEEWRCATPRAIQSAHCAFPSQASVSLTVRWVCSTLSLGPLGEISKLAHGGQCARHLHGS